MLTRKGPLYAALTQILRSLDRTTTPILQNVQLTAGGGTLRIAGTDLKNYVVATLPCEGRFAACLPTKALAEFVKPDDVADKRGLVELLPEGTGKTTVAVEAALVTLASRPAEEFVVRPGETLERSSWTQIASWDAVEFGEKLRWVLLAAGSDTSRSSLMGVYFDGSELVATDGCRLHAARLAGFHGDPLLVCARTLSSFLRALPKKGAVTMERSGDLLRVVAGGWEMETAVMLEQFPRSYRQVIPKVGSEAFAVEVERKTLVHALSRVAKARSSAKGVRLVVNGAITLERDHGDGTTTSTVPVVTTTHVGPDSTIGADLRYLLDALDAGDDVVTARFGGSLDPICLTLGGGMVGVIMPMRL